MCCINAVQVENARLREERPDAAALIEATAETDRYREEASRLAAEIDELRQMLHESQESEAKAVGEALAARTELEDLRSQREAAA